MLQTFSCILLVEILIFKNTCKLLGIEIINLSYVTTIKFTMSILGYYNTAIRIILTDFKLSSFHKQR